ncbi:MAG: 3-phosphoserine/phosphohydroxythreonine transaminase [Methylotenera sp.]|nr:3-phosphoserine/phosphohydroxythreonine transaminase [Oligoflexia bacterium]
MTPPRRIYNFGAGPSILPVPVLEEASRGVLELGTSGMSILEVSHRGMDYEAIQFGARDRLLKIMGLSGDEYTVLFLGGGASLQFAMLPMNFLKAGETADYIHTGEWSAKAMKEAKKFGEVHVAGNSESEKFTRIPQALTFSANAKYVHLTTNNTIEGTQFHQWPDVAGLPLIADASSDILSRRIDFSKFAMIYAGAQKNLGPAGVTVVVIKKEFLAKANENGPTLLRYRTHADADSLYNTPPVFAIYTLGLVLKWIEAEGGLSKIEERNRRKAQLIYQALDAYPSFYDPTVSVKEDRSLMNITFRLRDVSLESEFLKGAGKLGMDGLKGHRSVGGFRASVYNAFPEAGAQALAEYLHRFALR